MQRMEIKLYIYEQKRIFYEKKCSAIRQITTSFKIQHDFDKRDCENWVFPWFGFVELSCTMCKLPKQSDVYWMSLGSVVILCRR